MSMRSLPFLAAHDRTLMRLPKMPSGADGLRDEKVKLALGEFDTQVVVNTKPSCGPPLVLAPLTSVSMIRPCTHVSRTSRFFDCPATPAIASECVTSCGSRPMSLNPHRWAPSSLVFLLLLMRMPDDESCESTP